MWNDCQKFKWMADANTNQPHVYAKFGTLKNKAGCKQDLYRMFNIFTYSLGEKVGMYL